MFQCGFIKLIWWCSGFWLCYDLKGYSEAKKLKWKRKREEKRTCFFAFLFSIDLRTVLLFHLSDQADGEFRVIVFDSRLFFFLFIIIYRSSSCS